MLFADAVVLISISASIHTPTLPFFICSHVGLSSPLRINWLYIFSNNNQSVFDWYDKYLFVCEWGSAAVSELVLGPRSKQYLDRLGGWILRILVILFLPFFRSISPPSPCLGLFIVTEMCPWCKLINIPTYPWLVLILILCLSLSTLPSTRFPVHFFPLPVLRLMSIVCQCRWPWL